MDQISVSVHVLDQNGLDVTLLRPDSTTPTEGRGNVPNSLPYHHLQFNPQCSQNLLNCTYNCLCHCLIAQFLPTFSSHVFAPPNRTEMGAGLYVAPPLGRMPLEGAAAEIAAILPQAPRYSPSSQSLQQCVRNFCELRKLCLHLHVQLMTRDEAGHADPSILHPPVPMQLRGPAPNGT